MGTDTSDLVQNPCTSAVQKDVEVGVIGQNKLLRCVPVVSSHDRIFTSKTRREASHCGKSSSVVAQNTLRPRDLV